MEFDIDKEDLMENIRTRLKPELATISYNTYIAPLKIESIENSHIVFQCDVFFKIDALEHKYASLILETIKDITNREFTFSVHSLEADPNKKNTNNSSKTQII